jgi:hypothetical protein
MLRLLNAHTAPIDGTAPGAEAEYDENNPGVRAHMAAGHLVDPATVASAVSEAQAAELVRLRAKVAELEAAAPAAAPAKKPAAKPATDKGEG